MDLNFEIFGLEEEISSLGALKQEKGKLQTETEQLEKQKPKPTTEEEKSIEAKLTLLNDQKNQVNEQIADYKTRLNTIETIRTKVEALQTYVGKQLADIKNDLQSVGLADIYEKIRFSVSPNFNTALDSKKREIGTKIQGLQGAAESEDRISEDQTKEPLEIDLNILTSGYISKLSLDKISDLITVLESKSSLAEDKRKTVKAFEEMIEGHQKRVRELTKSIKEIEEQKIPLLPQKIKERDETYKNYFLLLQEEKEILEELYAPLKEKLIKESLGGKNEIEFFARIELDVENFFGKSENIIDFSRTGRHFTRGLAWDIRVYAPDFQGISYGPGPHGSA